MTFPRVGLLGITLLSVGLAACSDDPVAPAAAPPEASPTPARTAGPTGQVIPDRYIVVFNAGATDTPELARRLAAAHGGKLHHTYRHALRGFSATLPAPAVEALERHPSIAYIEPDQVATGTVTTQPGATWGLDRIDQFDLPLNGSYTYNRAGKDLNVYVLDSGIETSHPEFGGRASVGFDAMGDGLNGQDCHGHGTHVAGTIGGSTYGVAKLVRLVSVRVLGGDCTQPPTGSAAGLLAGMDWVKANRSGPSIVNMSLQFQTIVSSVDDAVRDLVASGVTVVVAAGNNGANACNYTPARVAEAITVGATSISDQQASFSNHGSCLDIYAPGAAITSAGLNGGTAMLSGTSMAAPHVAGVAALYWKRDPTAPQTTVYDAVLWNATHNRLSGLGAGSPNRITRAPLRIPVHRTWNGGNDHMYGFYSDEGAALGYTLEHRDYFYLAPDPAANHVPLYRCYTPWNGDHFLSTDPNCEGSATDYVIGQIATTQLTATVPLYRLLNPGNGDRLHTTDPAERSFVLGWGWQDEGITGYVYQKW